MRSLAFLLFAQCAVPTLGFAPLQQSSISRQSHGNQGLFDVISGTDPEKADPVDEGLGGVKLAKESVIKIIGEVRHKPGKADSRATDLMRYNQLCSIDESKATDGLAKSGGKLLCRGKGTELYKDPGDGTDKVIVLGPMQAIKDAVSTSASAMESKSVVVNFLGGDDLILSEVTDATNEFVVMMDIPTKTKVSFNSISHSSIPAGTCSVTVASVSEETAEGLSGVDASIAAGEVYCYDGTWYTVEAGDINSAVA